jgi:hypothetical protein
MRPTGGVSFHVELADSQVVSQAADIHGPINQAALRLKIGETMSWPVNGDKSNAHLVEHAFR